MAWVYDAVSRIALGVIAFALLGVVIWAIYKIVEAAKKLDYDWATTFQLIKEAALGVFFIAILGLVCWVVGDVLVSTFAPHPHHG